MVASPQKQEQELARRRALGPRLRVLQVELELQPRATLGLAD